VDRSRAIFGVITAATAAVLLSGCAAPDYTYVRGGDGSTYFKVPSGWKQVDQRQLDVFYGDPNTVSGQKAKQATWMAAFDAQAQPTVEHLLPAAGADGEPFVMAKVLKLTKDEQNKVSLDSLRNAILPVALSTDERKALEQNPQYPLKNFELVADQVLPTQDGVRGVRSIFNLRVGNGPLQTFDETSFLSADGTTISTLLIRCSATCFRQRFSEIDLVAQSFKVKRLLNQ
jgi:hypothetical protein